MNTLCNLVVVWSWVAMTFATQSFAVTIGHGQHNANVTSPSRRRLRSYSPVEASLSQFKKASSLRAEESPPVQRSQVECIIDSLPSSSSPHKAVLRIEVCHDLSPVLADAFLARVAAGYYSGCYIFRVLVGFVAQFGLNPKWAGEKFKRPKQPAADAPLASPPHGQLSNTRGTLNFAGGSPTQVFVNIGNNARLDGEGRPFATLDEASMSAIDALHQGYKDGDGQVGAVNRGEVETRFPEMSWVESCRVVQPT